MKAIESGCGASTFTSERRILQIAGKSALSVRRRVYWNDRGELIGIWYADFVHTERHLAAKRCKELRPTPEQHIYTDDELVDIDEHSGGWSVVALRFYV
jgi:hypothetical protein